MKIILFMVISINGYIARIDKNEDWISNLNWLEVVRLAKKYGNIIWGRKTIELVNSWDSKYINDLKGVQKVILTNKTSFVDTYDTKYVHSPEKALNYLKMKNFKIALLDGGSTNNTAFAKKNLIDEIIINIQPYILGKGIPLFKPDDFEMNLEFMGIKKLENGVKQLHYRVIK